MTNEEALKINAEYRTSWVIARHKEKPLSEEAEEYIDGKIEYHNIIQNALKKQIPEEEAHFFGDHGFFKCKNTKKEIRYPLLSFKDLDYCPRCGQKLDWSKE